MKTYSIISPSVDGVLSDDNLYFEGVSRPPAIYAIRDQESDVDDHLEVLVKYFHDVYNLFLRKLSAFAMFESANDEEIIKMQALLQELIKVKKLIEKATVNDK